MKSIPIFLLLIVIMINSVFCQITVPECNISIIKSDSIVWLKEYQAIIICRSTGKRESVIVGRSKSYFNLDTLQFKITESKSLVNGEVARVFVSSKYYSFIDIDPFACSFHIFKKRRKSLFSKKYWEEICPPLILSPVESLLLDPYVSKLDIINKISFLDIFTIKVTYTNGKEDTHSFDNKSLTYNKKIKQSPKTE